MCLTKVTSFATAGDDDSTYTYFHEKNDYSLIALSLDGHGLEDRDQTNLWLLLRLRANQRNRENNGARLSFDSLNNL